MKLVKYPRTRHVEGSRLQAGDVADDKPIAELGRQTLIVEEKLDGANSAISFDTGGGLLLQSRGHYLIGGGRERHFGLLKTWAATHADRLRRALSDRFVMYGEWLYAKHTVFYDRLPHYFMEFAVHDRRSGDFLSAAARHDVLAGLPVMPAPVIHRGGVTSTDQLVGLVRPSLYKSADWREALASAAHASGSRPDRVAQQTEDSELAEGIYLKLERGRAVADRFKYVRHDFLQAIEMAEGHWLDRPLLVNALDEGADLFAPKLGLRGAYDGPDA